MLSTHGILPGHLLPTRLGSCLDHVMLKINKKLTTAYTSVIKTSITDHYTTFLGLNNHLHKSANTKSYEIINYENAEINLHGKNIELLLLSNDPNYVLKNLTSKLYKSLHDSKVTKLVPKNKRIIKPWITPGILRCIRNRDKMQLKLRGNPENDVLRTTFRRYRNFVNNLIKKLKRKYDFEQLERNKNNSKGLWTTIKNINLLLLNRSITLINSSPVLVLN